MKIGQKTKIAINKKKTTFLQLLSVLSRACRLTLELPASILVTHCINNCK